MGSSVRLINTLIMIETPRLRKHPHRYTNLQYQAPYIFTFFKAVFDVFVLSTDSCAEATDPRFLAKVLVTMLPVLTTVFSTTMGVFFAVGVMTVAVTAVAS